MKKTFIAVLLVVLFSGCRSFTEHPWTLKAKVDSSEVDYVKVENLSRVKNDKRESAIHQLESESFVKLSKSEYLELAGQTRDLALDENAYLVRGVSWNQIPLYSTVAFCRKNSTLYVLQYSFNGEIYIPGNYKSIANPMIVILDKAISQVIPDAVRGGDWIFWGISDEYSWTEHTQ